VVPGFIFGAGFAVSIVGCFVKRSITEEYIIVQFMKLNPGPLLAEASRAPALLDHCVWISLPRSRTGIDGNIHGTGSTPVDSWYGN
jgi:hypothetical protein